MFVSAYYASIVKSLYNLLYYQVVAQLTCSMSSRERQYILHRYRNSTTIDQRNIPSTSNNCSINPNQNSLVETLITVIESFDSSELYIDDTTTTTASTTNIKTNIETIELQVQRLCLPFLRIAALLKFHLYEQQLPDVRTPQTEFVRLVYYLELVTEGMNWSEFNAAVALNWANSEIKQQTPKLWCTQFNSFVSRGQIAARNFMIEQHVIWHPPRLLSLPREYEKIFTVNKYFYIFNSSHACHHKF